MYGAQAVSEQELVEVVMGRLPEGSVLVGDANFGVFSVAYAATRLIARQVQPNDGSAPFLLCLVTSLSADQEQVLGLYGQRWNIETDLRSLKSTLDLGPLSCTTPKFF
jgi:hypothetical protein